MWCTNLEEEADDENLQGTHADHHGALDETEVDDPALGASDGAEVSVLSRAEILLVSRDGGQLARHLVDGFFEFRRLLRGRPLLRGELGLLFVFDLSIAHEILVNRRADRNVDACFFPPQRPACPRGVWTKNDELLLTAISKSTNFSEYVLISLSKQNL